MATLLLDSTSATVGQGVDRAAPAGRSLTERFAALFSTFSAARERQAQAKVDGYLASLNDETLLDLGLDPRTVRRPGVDPVNRFYL